MAVVAFLFGGHYAKRGVRRRVDRLLTHYLLSSFLQGVVGCLILSYSIVEALIKNNLNHVPAVNPLTDTHYKQKTNGFPIE